MEHLNRNAEAHRLGAETLRLLIENMQSQLEGQARFQSLLVQYLQTITIYIDSRDCAIGGSEIRERFALNEQRLLALTRLIDEPGQALPRPSAAALPMAGARRLADGGARRVRRRD